MRFLFVTLQILLLFAIAPLFSTPIRLKDEMAKAKSGDYLVTLQNRTYTLLLIKEVTGDLFVLEEVMVPQEERKLSSKKWREWLAAGAPGHTSWISYEVDRRSGRLSHCYSFSRKGWVEVGDMDQFLTTLITLKFEEVADQQRRKKGRMPSMEERDLRPLWHPPLISEGKQLNGVSFKALEATWPKDGSELSGATLTVYLPSSAGPFPSYFPYWIEVNRNLVSSKLRVIDSGRALFSPAILP